MATATFFIPSVNVIGSGALNDAATAIAQHGFRHVLIVTDKVLFDIGVVKQVQELLEKSDV